jgi:hypothetical protein
MDGTVKNKRRPQNGANFAGKGQPPMSVASPGGIEIYHNFQILTALNQFSFSKQA